MELCDLGDEASVAAAAAAVAAELERPDLAERGRRAGRRLLARRRRCAAAAAAGPGAVYRELPIGALVDGVVVSGAVDLLYRDGDEWVVVDYKTDRGADAGVLRERYDAAGRRLRARRRGGHRRRGARGRASSPRAADGLVVRVPVDDELRERARGEVGAAAAAGRALRPDELGGHPA